MTILNVKILCMILLGYAMGIITLLLGDGYYENRFEDVMKKTFLSYVFSAAACGFAALAFCRYGYDTIECLALLFLISCLFVVGRIDKAKQIIPNAIIILLFVIRTILYLLEVILHKDYGFENCKIGIAGLIVAAIAFGVFKLICKDGIGMGDVKLLVLMGYYVGIYRCFLMLFTILLLAVIQITVKIITKKIKRKECISFGPYIAAGGYVALLIGI